MPWTHFLAATVVGAALWVGVWTTLAYRLGREADARPWIWHHLGLFAAIAVPGLIPRAAARPGVRARAAVRGGGGKMSASLRGWMGYLGGTAGPPE
ncbi:MAG: hypothetical protein ACK5MQ_06495, partial [Pikeienuella sp.]